MIKPRKLKMTLNRKYKQTNLNIHEKIESVEILAGF